MGWGSHHGYLPSTFLSYISKVFARLVGCYILTYRADLIDWVHIGVVAWVILGLRLHKWSQWSGQKFGNLGPKALHAWI